jgi:hypothetical protein
MCLLLNYDSYLMYRKSASAVFVKCVSNAKADSCVILLQNGETYNLLRGTFNIVLATSSCH